MKLKWSNEAVADVARLHDFLAKVNPTAAARTAQTLTLAPRRLLDRPQSGRQLDQYLPREVRRIIVGNYEMRYGIGRPFRLHLDGLAHTRRALIGKWPP